MDPTLLLSALQTAVVPVILISGVGLLLLTMTNRLGRVIDRARIITPSEGPLRTESRTELSILIHRARVLRWAIWFSVMSALLSAVLVLSLFISILFKVSHLRWIGSLFTMSLLCIIFSLGLFMRDVNKSLEALRTKLKSRS